MSEDDGYYPEGIDKAEFDAMVAEEMARLEREAREAAQDASYGGSYEAPDSYARQPYSPEPVQRVPELYGAPSNLPRPPVEKSPRDVKRERQAEYARQLRHDEEVRSRGPSREGSRGNSGARRPMAGEDDRRKNNVMNLQLGVPKPVLDIFGNAAKISARSPSKNVISDEQKERIDRQREYARQLESDQQVRQQHSGHRSQRAEPRQRVSSGRRRQEEDMADVEVYAPRGSSRPGAGDGRSKAEKQQEYARQLEEDKYLRDRAAVERDDPPPRRMSGRRRSGDGASDVYAGGLQIGGASDNHVDRNAKRRQQEEYAAQLRMQAGQQPSAPTPWDDKTRRYEMERHQDDNNQTSIQLGGYDVSTSQRISNKRAQQREYSDELNAQVRHAPASSVAEERRKRLMSEGGNSLMMGNDVSTAEQRQKKISEQRKYNRELQDASNAQAVAGPARKAYVRREADSEHPLGGSDGGVGLFGHQESTAIARDRKKHAQEEYSQQLRADQGGFREPNLPVGRGYDSGRMCSPGQGGGYRPGSGRRDSRHSEAIISGRDKGFVGLDKGRYTGPADINDPEVRNTEYYKADENIDQFRPVAVSDRVRDYKDRQAAYAQLLAQDAETRDSARASNGVEDQTSSSAQARKRATSTGRLRPGRNEVDYSGNQGTGLMIGGMDINTAQVKQNKILQQQQYAKEIADSKGAQPIPESYRSIHRDQTEYMGNGLPGGANVPFRSQPGSTYHNNVDFGAARNAGSRQNDFQLRGTSTGGGRSQIHF